VWWTKVGVVLLEQEETENNWTRHGHYKMLPEILRLRFKRGEIVKRQEEKKHPRFQFMIKSFLSIPFAGQKPYNLPRQAKFRNSEIKTPRGDPERQALAL
jgi:hypothetical protein